MTVFDYLYSLPVKTPIPKKFYMQITESDLEKIKHEIEGKYKSFNDYKCLYIPDFFGF